MGARVAAAAGRAALTAGRQEGARALAGYPTAPSRLLPPRPRRTLIKSPTERRHRRMERVATIPAVDASRITPVRLRVLLVVCVLASVGIVARLVQLQVYEAPVLAERARRQLVRTEALPAERGSIFDRSGRDLAITVRVPTIAANPRLVTDPIGEAKLLSSLLNVDAATIQEKLSRGGAKFTYLARQVDEESAKRVTDRARDLPGVFSFLEPKRFLPADTLAVPVLGKVGLDGEGLTGLEYQYRGVLAGKPGKLVSERDQQGREIPGGRIDYDPSARGDDLVLTIDRSLQHETETRLAAQITATSAKGGVALVMDTASGDLLAISNLVTEAKARGQAPQVVPADKDHAVTNVYEPGSVTKLITIAGAIEDGKVKPDQTLSVPNMIQVGDHSYTEHESHPTAAWSLTDIVANSSNVGTIMIGQQLGKQRFDSYLRAFGFGARTGLGDPGESPGILLDPAHYSSTSMGSFPIGQGIAVTAVQMLAAYNAVANGGTYVAPRLVRAMVGPDGTQRPMPASETHRVVSTQTAAEMTKMLTEVVRVGTATLAAVDGYTVAGKTGTARKPLLNQRGYEEGAYVSSFAGFAPAEQPQLTAMVILDQPTPIYGGLVAAPVFADLTRYALRELHIPPPAIALKPTAARDANTQSAKGIGDLGDSQAPTMLSPTSLPGASTTTVAPAATKATKRTTTTTTRGGSGRVTPPGGAATSTSTVVRATTVVTQK